MSSIALELNNVVQTFHQGETPLEVLRGVNLKVEAGEIVALVGPSGSGKSTLLQIAGLLEQPLSGEVIVKGVNVKDLGDDRRTEIRRQELGFVFQSEPEQSIWGCFRGSGNRWKYRWFFWYNV